MDCRVLIRCLMTSTHSSFVSSVPATKSNSRMLVEDLKIIEKAVSFLKFSISVLWNYHLTANCNEVNKQLLPSQDCRIILNLVEDVCLEALPHFADVMQTKTIFVVGI